MGTATCPDITDCIVRRHSRHILDGITWGNHLYGRYVVIVTGCMLRMKNMLGIKFCNIKILQKEYKWKSQNYQSNCAMCTEIKVFIFMSCSSSISLSLAALATSYKLHVIVCLVISHHEE